MSQYHNRGIDPLAKLGYAYSQEYLLECLKPWASARIKAIELMISLLNKAKSHERSDIINVYLATDSKGKANSAHLESVMTQVKKMGDKRKTIADISVELKRVSDRLAKMIGGYQ